MKGFNVAGWIFIMKNKFKWTDRQDITSDGESLTFADMVSQADQALKNQAKTLKAKKAKKQL